MTTAYVNIGSNQGDRRDNLARAVALIAGRLHVAPRVSAVVESRPWGYESPNPYLNVGITFATALPPGRLLDLLLEVERSLSPTPHRTAAGGYADRTVDIDLIACGNTVLDDAPTPAGRRITLPHPLMHLRRFVLDPMRQLWPQWRHPLLDATPADLLNLLK